MVTELQLRVLPRDSYSEQAIREYLVREKDFSHDEITAVRVLKKSIDARQRTIFVNLTVRVFVNETPTADEYKHTVYPCVAD